MGAVWKLSPESYDVKSWFGEIVLAATWGGEGAAEKGKATAALQETEGGWGGRGGEGGGGGRECAHAEGGPVSGLGH